MTPEETAIRELQRIQAAAVAARLITPELQALAEAAERYGDVSEAFMNFTLGATESLKKAGLKLNDAAKAYATSTRKARQAKETAS